MRCYAPSGKPTEIGIKAHGFIIVLVSPPQENSAAPLPAIAQATKDDDEEKEEKKKKKTVSSPTSKTAVTTAIEWTPFKGRVHEVPFLFDHSIFVFGAPVCV